MVFTSCFIIVVTLFRISLFVRQLLLQVNGTQMGEDAEGIL